MEETADPLTGTLSVGSWFVGWLEETRLIKGGSSRKILQEMKQAPKKREREKRKIRKKERTNGKGEERKKERTKEKDWEESEVHLNKRAVCVCTLPNGQRKLESHVTRHKHSLSPEGRKSG